MPSLQSCPQKCCKKASVNNTFLGIPACCIVEEQRSQKKKKKKYNKNPKNQKHTHFNSTQFSGPYYA